MEAVATVPGYAEGRVVGRRGLSGPVCPELRVCLVLPSSARMPGLAWRCPEAAPGGGDPQHLPLTRILELFAQSQDVPVHVSGRLLFFEQ